LPIAAKTWRAERYTKSETEPGLGSSVEGHLDEQTAVKPEFADHPVEDLFRTSSTADADGTTETAESITRSTDDTSEQISADARVASDIRIVTFRDLPAHGDLTDWVQADPSGHGYKKLLVKIEAAPKFERPALPFINMSWWDSEPVPEQEWTVPFKIPIQECALFSGEGGAGKSMEGLHLCSAHALGAECWHTTVRQGAAIFIDAEDTEAVIHRRLAAVREHYGVTFADLIKGGLHLMSLVGHDAVLATVSRSGKIEATLLYGQLL
jgi:hypothetical protein